MPTQSPLSSELREQYANESARLQREFSAAKDGPGYLRQRSELVDNIVRRLWAQIAAGSGGESSEVVVAAIGDLGRQTPFPYSEIELLVLSKTREAAGKWADGVR